MFLSVQNVEINFILSVLVMVKISCWTRNPIGDKFSSIRGQAGCRKVCPSGKIKACHVKPEGIYNCGIPLAYKKGAAAPTHDKLMVVSQNHLVISIEALSREVSLKKSRWFM